jgi:hypothetical protein
MRKRPLTDGLFENPSGLQSLPHIGRTVRHFNESLLYGEPKPYNDLLATTLEVFSLHHFTTDLSEFWLAFVLGLQLGAVEVSTNSL